MEPRLRAFLLHFIVSVVVTGTTLAAMRFFWYPGAFASLQGWKDLLWVVVAVDIVLGPVLTFVVYSPSKKTLRFDLAVIVLIQFSALSYGIFTSAMGRPVYLVFLIDRFEVVTATEYPKEERMTYQGGEFSNFSLTGPKAVTAAMPATVPEKNKVIFSAVTGGGLKIMLRYYRPYATAAKHAVEKGKNIASVRKSDPALAETLLEWTKAERKDVSDVVFVPLKGRLSYGIVMLNASDGNIISSAAINPTWY